jgi:uncharacterized protein YqjF (DUF2071 family)
MASLFSSPPRILEATARHRVVVSYAVAPDCVAPHLPSGLVPDTRNGRAFVHLVGVQLVKVRVLGMSGPGFRRVPAVELQVLVQEASSARRGTITLQAHVPRRLVAWGARLSYGEPVDVASMQAVRRRRAGGVEMTYRFDSAGREQRLRVLGHPPPVMPSPSSLAYRLMDRNWRYGTAGNGDLLRTRIERPVAPIYRVQEYFVTVRWGAVYGDEWQFLDGREPTVVLFSPDQPVVLRWRKRIGSD